MHSRLFVSIFLLICTLSYNLVATNGYWTARADAIIAQKAHKMRIGIICAHPNEVGRLIESMQDVTKSEKGMRTYYEGTLYGIDTVAVIARVGKVAASSTATHLIGQYHVDIILYTGVAGACDEALEIGDIVIANGLIQHDMDSSPLTPAFTIPFLKIKTFCPDSFLQEKAYAAAKHFLSKQYSKTLTPETIEEFKLHSPKVVLATIASGDKFFSDKTELAKLKQKLPEACCVEMEGAAVAQVCYEYDVPCVVIRIISDRAVQNAEVDCLKFMKQVSHLYSEKIIENLCESIRSVHENT